MVLVLAPRPHGNGLTSRRVTSWPRFCAWRSMRRESHRRDGRLRAREPRVSYSPYLLSHEVSSSLPSSRLGGSASVCCWLSACGLLWLRGSFRCRSAPRRSSRRRLPFTSRRASATSSFSTRAQLSRQSGDLAAGEIGETPTLSLEHVPVKLVQLGLDPCFYALCSFADYGAGVPLRRMPLAIQLPTLMLLPICVVAVGAALARLVRGRNTSPHLAALGLLAEMTIAACGLAVGCLASTMTGSSHLRYGFAREFLAAALLSAVVFATLASAAIWALLKHNRRHGRPWTTEFATALAVIATAAAFTLALAVARAEGLPRLDSRHLGVVEYNAACQGRTCDIAITATTVAGERISVPRASTLTFACGEGRQMRSPQGIRPKAFESRMRGKRLASSLPGRP